MRHCLLHLVALSLLATPLHAQGLRSQVSELFHFGECPEPLCLTVTGAHGDHYIPASQAQSGQIIGFLTNAIGTSIATVPVGGASGGSTFTFEGGLPVRSSVSAGPIFAERAQTIGRGRLLTGANATAYRFTSFRGTPLDELTFNFTHTNVGADAYGDPAFENDVIQVTTDLDVAVMIATVFATYGLTERIDFGVALPVVHTSVRGESRAQVVPFGTTPHSFSETEVQLSANAAMDGSATGIGDVLLRAKANLVQSDALSTALLADVRLPTGSEEDLLGSGAASVRGLGIVSARHGDFSPHANGGFVYRGGEFERNAIVGALGFDHLIAPWVTLAVDFLGSVELGAGKLDLPPPQLFEAPYERTLPLTNIRDRSDTAVYSSVGAKLSRGEAITFVVNGLIPIVRGGFQPDAALTIGFEYNP